MSDIFISYARSDRGRAETLAQALEQQGWSVWWDFQILPGESFSRVIDVALENAKCVIVLWSKESVSSEWVQDEASEGARREILIPILIEDVRIPLGFRGKQAARLIDWQGESSTLEFQQLLKAVAKILGRQEVKKTEDTDDAHSQVAHGLKLVDESMVESVRRKAAEEIKNVLRSKAADTNEPAPQISRERIKEGLADLDTQPLQTPVEEHEILDILKKNFPAGSIELAPIHPKQFRDSPLLSAIPKNETILGMIKEGHQYLIFTGRGIYFKGDGLFSEVARIAYEHFPNRVFQVDFINGVSLGAQGFFRTLFFKKELVATLEDIKSLVIMKRLL